MVLVSKRSERRPVYGRVGAFPEVFRYLLYHFHYAYCLISVELLLRSSVLYRDTNKPMTMYAIRT